MSVPRTAIVTGASRGIGRAIAVALGSAGFNVVVNYNSNRAAADECVALVQQAGGGALAFRADVADLDDQRKLVEAAVGEFGDIDLLVNNAGVAPKVRADILQADPESFDEVIRTNLRGPYFLTVLVANRMVVQVTRKEGRQDPAPAIVNIGSVSAYAASVNRGDYCVSKAGVSMMTSLFAARLAEYGINVYEIRPGVIATDMTSPENVKAKYDRLIAEGNMQPVRRWGEPEDVAKAVAAVAQGFFPYSTGQVLDVDGGFHLRQL